MPPDEGVEGLGEPLVYIRSIADIIIIGIIKTRIPEINLEN